MFTRSWAGARIFVIITLWCACFATDAIAQSKVPFPASQSAEGSYHALVIGINQYPAPLPTLQTAVNDARAIAHILQERFGFEVELLLDQNATRSNILNTLNKYRRVLKENDSLLIYYAGHGDSDPDADKAYWLPVDAAEDSSSNWIISDELTTDIRVQPARHVLIISDSCYSGGLARDANSKFRPDDEMTFLNKMQASRSRTLMASGGNEPVADGGGNGHSVFAGAVLKSLERLGSDQFTAAELFGVVQQQVAGRSEQIPRYMFIRNSSHDDGDFVFIRRSGPGQGSYQELKTTAAGSTSSAATSMPATVVTPAPAKAASSPAPTASVQKASTGTAQSDRQIYRAAMQSLDVNEVKAAADKVSDPVLADALRLRANKLLASGSQPSPTASTSSDLIAIHERADAAFSRGTYYAAMPLYKQLADAGDSTAMAAIGTMYDRGGEGVPKDIRQAAQWTLKAAQAGNTAAMQTIGLDYMIGDGIAQDDSQAAHWLQGAADAGQVMAMGALGFLYEKGRGVPKDLTLAVNWYRKAAAAVDNIAQQSLQRLGYR